MSDSVIAVPHLTRPQQYERTCNSCGFQWKLTREQAGFSAGGWFLQRFWIGRGGVSKPSAEATGAAVDAGVAYGQCPSCGVEDDFTERSVPKAS